MLLDAFKDIIKHTHSLGFLDMVKIIGSEDEAKLESIDSDKTVVFTGQMYQPIKGITSTVGLSRMSDLKGYIDFSAYASDSAKVDILTEKRNNEDVPVELQFKSGGSTSVYRFMAESMANEQIRVPPFKGATWNVVVEPTEDKIKELAYFSGVLGSFESTFRVSTSKGVLNFSIGNGPTNRHSCDFAKDITGELKHQWSWPLAQVLSILKLSGSETKMYFSDMGALKIDVDSGIGKYSYILPARSK